MEVNSAVQGFAIRPCDHEYQDAVRKVPESSGREIASPKIRFLAITGDDPSSGGLPDKPRRQGILELIRCCRGPFEKEGLLNAVSQVLQSVV
jgi:hypothetical protein